MLDDSFYICRNNNIEINMKNVTRNILEVKGVYFIIK